MPRLHAIAFAWFLGLPFFCFMAVQWFPGTFLDDGRMVYAEVLVSSVGMVGVPFLLDSKWWRRLVWLLVIVCMQLLQILGLGLWALHENGLEGVQ